MKKWIIILGLMSLLAVMSISAQANVHGTNIHFYVCNGGPTGGGGHSGGDGSGHPRGPIMMPEASLDGHTLYMEGEHPGYMLSLVDSASGEADVVYQVYVPASTGVIVLPAALSGTYELQLYGGGAYYFYAEITL